VQGLLGTRVPGVRVSRPGDVREREADRVAETVLRMTGPPGGRTRRAAVSSLGDGPPPVPELVAGTGRPLPDSACHFLQIRFGGDEDYDGLRVPVRDLDAPNVMSDPVLRGYAHQFLGSIAAAQRTTTLDRVREPQNDDARLSSVRKPSSRMKTGLRRRNDTADDRPLRLDLPSSQVAGSVDVWNPTRTALARRTSRRPSSFSRIAS